MKTLTLLIALITLVSCDPVKRHNRLVDKYPYVHRDVTQVIHDTTTIIVPEIKHDTTFIKTKEIDTFIIEKERLKVVIRQHFDTMYVDASCESDTITVYKEITVPMYVSEKHKNKYGWIWWIVIFVLIIAFLLYLFKKILL